MIKVLVVDDDFMVAKVHSGFVQRVPGFEVVGRAHTGREALQTVRNLRPDLVLLDIYLPDVSGLDVLRQLRESGARVDVLAVTAARDVDTIRTAAHGGVVHYLIKPFGFEALRDALERYAHGRARLHSADEVAQEDVDRIFGVLATTPARLPKGLTSQTADLVEQAMRDADRDLSAEECAQLIGLSRVSARRYLEHFVATGHAEVGLRYGIAGRPQRRYRWTGAAPQR